MLGWAGDAKPVVVDAVVIVFLYITVDSKSRIQDPTYRLFHNNFRKVKSRTVCLKIMYIVRFCLFVCSCFVFVVVGFCFVLFCFVFVVVVVLLFFLGGGGGVLLLFCLFVYVLLECRFVLCILFCFFVLAFSSIDYKGLDYVEVILKHNTKNVSEIT